MGFLNPFALLFGLLGGLIVLMYLLKLRRKPEVFSSTLLWMKSIQDLTANAPFQKLRQNLLMYLQILMLLLVAFAIARPTLWLNRHAGASRIVMIDNTASMNATDGGGKGTRLDAAKAAARAMVSNMRPGDQMMVVTFGGSAAVAQAFTAERATLNAAIDAIPATDAEADIRNAFLLAQGVRKVDSAATITVVSDGGVGYLSNLIGEAKRDPVEFVKIGESEENRGIVAFDIRESFERKGEAQVFAEVENFSAQPHEASVRCLIDGKLEQVKEAKIDPRGKQGFVFTGLSGQAKTFRLELAGADALPTDDAVDGLVNLDSNFKILLVTGGNFFLEKMAGLVPGARVSKVDIAQYDATQAWDLVIFDQCRPPALGPGHYLFLNAVPPIEGFSQGAEPLKAQAAVDWNRLHPVTRFVTFDELAVGEAISLKAPDWCTTLVDSSDGALIVGGDKLGTRVVCVAFDIYSTDWPLQIGFPIFFSNAVRWLAGGGEGSLTEGKKTGDTVTLRAKAGETAPITVVGPKGDKWEEIKPNEQGVAYFTKTLGVGIYEAKQGEASLGKFAVNLLSRGESDIAPKGEIVSSEQKVVATSIGRENREIWPWLALAGLLILVTEWHIYCRRSWL